MRRLSLAFLAAVLFAFAPAARAQAPAPAAPAPASPTGYHTHDGFFLQMDLGYGTMSSSADLQAGVLGTLDTKFSGFAGAFSIAIGGAVTSNLILAGHLWGVAVTSPDIEVNGQKGSTSDLTQSLSGVGLNLTYYVMPLNLYLSATPSIGMLALESNGSRYETKNGFAIRLAVGKEWWVSDNWGLGLNLQYAHSSNGDKDGLGTWGSNWFGVAFSATYN